MMKYPEHEKLRSVAEQTQAAGEFLEWLQTEKGFALAHNASGEPVYVNAQDLLAEWKGIDRKAIEREKREMLDEMRRMNGAA